MTTSILKLSLLGLLTVALSGLPLGAIAKDTNAAPAAVEKKAVKEAKPKKTSTLPIHGKLKSVDKTAKTISIGEQTLHITSETIITKAGKPATLEDGVVGEEVSATYKKGDDGKLTTIKVRFGAKTETSAKPDAKKEKAKKD